jgi:hypothetical protein
MIRSSLNVGTMIEKVMAYLPMIAVPTEHRPMIGISTLVSQPHLKSSIVPMNCARAKAMPPSRAHTGSGLSICGPSGLVPRPDR